MRRKRQPVELIANELNEWHRGLIEPEPALDRHVVISRLAVSRSLPEASATPAGVEPLYMSIYRRCRLSRYPVRVTAPDSAPDPFVASGLAPASAFAANLAASCPR